MAQAIRIEIFGRRGEEVQIGRIRKQGPHRPPVQRPIRLRPWASDGRAFASIEQLEVNARCIGRTPHQAVQRIDFPHKMALADAANRWIARHLADRRKRVRQQQRAGANARGRCRGFASSVATPNYNDIERVAHGLPCAIKPHATAKPLSSSANPAHDTDSVPSRTFIINGEARPWPMG
jgi:hypothetical protein